MGNNSRPWVKLPGMGLEVRVRLTIGGWRMARGLTGWGGYTCRQALRVRNCGSWRPEMFAAETMDPVAGLLMLAFLALAGGGTLTERVGQVLSAWLRAAGGRRTGRTT